jgi:hypothetical protein
MERCNRCKYPMINIIDQVSFVGRTKISAKAGNGLTASMQASFAGHVEVVQILLNAAADLDTPLDNGSTALMAAASILPATFCSKPCR